MAKSKNFSAFVWVFGWLLDLASTFRKVTEKLGIPFDAYERLGSPEGRATIEKIARLIHEDWRAGGGDAVEEYERYGAKVEGRALTVDQSASLETITIPNLSFQELIDWSHEEMRKAGFSFTHFETDALGIIERDLPLVRGKTLQVFTYSFGRRHWTTQEGRDLQMGQGFDGNAAAYLVWVTETKNRGLSVSIANMDDRLFRDPGNHLHVPHFSQRGNKREFRLRSISGKWLGSRVLVAFRVV